MPAIGMNVLGRQNGTSAQDWTQLQSGAGKQWTTTDTSLPIWLHDREEREAYMEATVEQDVAWQIKINRESRNLNQKELAEIIGSKQSSISRAEDPTYGKHSIAMLVKIAHAFGCALLVRFVSYRDFVATTRETSVEALTVPSNE